MEWRIFHDEYEIDDDMYYALVERTEDSDRAHMMYSGDFLGHPDEAEMWYGWYICELPKLPETKKAPRYVHLTKVMVTYRNEYNEIILQAVYMNPEEVDKYCKNPPNLYKVVATASSDVLADLEPTPNLVCFIDNKGRRFSVVKEFKWRKLLQGIGTKRYRDTRNY